jgi:hypothetical protein
MNWLWLCPENVIFEDCSNETCSGIVLDKEVEIIKNSGL